MRRILPEPFVAAVVQAAPCFHDVEAGVERAGELIEAAARDGARLIVFPETWLPGYAYWSGDGIASGEHAELYRALHNNAVRLPGDEIGRIGAAARAAAATVVLGVTERDDAGRLFNTLAYIGEDGRLLGRHRKVMCTITEKLVWTNGDGSDLDAYETATGRVGGLICFEHQMALARFATLELGVQLHASAWPGHAFLHPAVDAATRHLAYENAAFVLVARDVMTRERLPVGTPLRDDPAIWETDGGSAIIAPGGDYLAGPVFGEETILTAEIDLERTLDVRWWVDGRGNYARPDIFQLRWDRSPKPTAVDG